MSDIAALISAMQLEREERKEEREAYKVEREAQSKLIEALLAKQNAPPDGDAIAAAALAAGNAASRAMPALMPVRKTADEIRKDKISQLHQALRKSYKLKDFKTTSNENIKDWISDFEEEVFNISKLARSLDLNAVPLSREEHVALLRDKLASCTKKELNRAFESNAPKLDWSTITVKDLKAVLMTQFGDKEPDMSLVFKCFGLSGQQYRKPKEMSVRKFYALWREQLPVCLQPSTEQEHKDLTDLILRCIFYKALDDVYLQQELCKLSGKVNLQKFFDEAILAEAKKSDIENTTEKSNCVDPSSAISINKYEYSYNGKNNYRGKNYRQFQRGSYGAGNHVQTGDKPSLLQKDVSNYRKPNDNNSQKNLNTNTQQGSVKKTPKCFTCGVYGHTKYKCDKKQTNNSNVSAKKVDFEIHNEIIDQFKAEISYPDNDTNDVSKNSGIMVKNVTTNVAVANVIPGSTDTKISVANGAKNIGLENYTNNSVATGNQISVVTGTHEVKAVKNLPQANIINAGVILNGIKPVIMELDTAASQNVMSQKLYDEVSAIKGLKPLKLSKSQVTMNLADGTPSNGVLGSTNMIIARADDPEKADEFPVFVVNGPHCLIGRPTLQRLWPDQYKGLSDIAAQSLKVVNGYNTSTVPDAFAAMENVTKVAKHDAVPDASVKMENVTKVTEHDAIPDTSVPERRKIPAPPKGIITQEVGEAYCKQIADVYPELFDGGQGIFKNVTAVMHLKEGHEGYLGVRKAANVPYGIEKEYNEALDKLYETLIPVDGLGLKAASQLVPIVKIKNGKPEVRMTTNYKSTINEHLMPEPYNFPTVNEQLEKLKGEYHSCIDIKGAFNQVPVKPGFSQEIMTMVTPRGFAMPKFMPFGIHSGPKIFQEGMDKLIHGMDGKNPIPNTACIVDDVCTTGADSQSHFDNLAELLYRLFAAGLKLNKSKCKFYQSSVKFLGKIVDKDGISMDQDSISAIVNMPAPTDRHTLRAFLGHMSYISRHVPDLRIARAPLDKLLKADTKFVWSNEQSKAFEKCKELASNSATLAHFDINLPIVLTTDASPVGLGACLSHRVKENGKTFLKPLSYASCSLKPAERNYAQVDREGLAVYWAVRHYRQYLYCRKFELHTDCSALTKIFGPKNDLGGCAIGRLNRWAAQLMEYEFDIFHIKGASNKLCDNLSRLPVPLPGKKYALFPNGTGKPISSSDLAGGMSVKCATIEQCFSDYEVMQSVACLAQLPDPGTTAISICKVVGTAPSAVWDILPLSIKDVAKATREDKVLGKLLIAVRTGEIKRDDLDLKSFVSLFNDLYIDQDVIFYGSRIVVPEKQQYRLLQELHMTHIGIVKMKEVSRNYFWWPNINKHIEDICINCEGCSRYRKKPPPAPLCPWPYAKRPMERVHIDFCEYRKKMILVMIDAYSKYIWTWIMGTDTTTLKTCAVLYSWFCERNGFPVTIVSDNGPQFTSHEFKDKMDKWGIKHVLTPPYHPASNGLAEKAVGIIKNHLKKMNSPATPIELFTNLQAVLRVHRSSPQKSTGMSPFETISKAPIPRLFNTLQLSHQKRQEANCSSVPIDKMKSVKNFKIGDNVLVYDTQNKLSSKGKVKDIKSKNSYIVVIDNVAKHISSDHMSLLPSNDININNDNNSNVNSPIQNVSDDKDINIILTRSKSNENNSNSNSVSNVDNMNDDELESEDEVDDIFVPSDVVYNNNFEYDYGNRRRYRSEAQKLNDSLSVNPPRSRLRSGK